MAILPAVCSDTSERPLFERALLWEKRLRAATTPGDLVERYRGAMTACELSDWRAEALFLRLLANYIDNEGAVAFCDVDADGDFDALWTDAGATQVWRNDAGVFVPTGEPGLSAGIDLSGENVDGLACGDVDNDGDVDIFLSTAGGPGYLFVNRTAPGAASPLAFTRDNAGIALDATIPSVAFGDYDGDGDLDLVAASDDGTNQLWQSHWDDSGRADYLQVRVLHPLVGGAARDEIGATVRLFEADGTTPVGPVQEVNGGRGYGSQAAAVLHFGLPSGPDRGYVVEVRFLEECGRPGPVVRQEIVPSSLGAPQVLEVMRPPDGGGKGRHECSCGPRRRER